MYAVCFYSSIFLWCYIFVAEIVQSYIHAKITEDPKIYSMLSTIILLIAVGSRHEKLIGKAGPFGGKALEKKRNDKILLVYCIPRPLTDTRASNILEYVPAVSPAFNHLVVDATVTPKRGHV